MRALLPAILLAVLPVCGCAYYDLDVEGKQCNDDHPCPSGLSCVETADGGAVCKKDAPDAGPDGADTGPCTESETACASDGDEVILVCHDGVFDPESCPTDQYCFSAGGTVTASCIDPCTETSECTAIVEEGYYCNTDSGHCEERGGCEGTGVVTDEDRCSPDLRQVLHCSSETGLDKVVDTCTEGEEYCDVYEKACLSFCDDDTGCSAGSSCNPDTRKCIPMGLCQSAADCTGSICVDPPAGACVVQPDTQGSTTGGAADLECFVGDPDPDTGPETCRLTGRVVVFFNGVEVDYDPNLRVQLYPIEPVLEGTPGEPALEAVVADDGSGVAQYTFDTVPTGTEYVMAVGCPDQDHPCTTQDYVTMYTFSVYLRADACQAGGGEISFSAPSIYLDNYLGYNNVPGHATPDNKKGLLLGKLKDCAENRILYGTGGVSMDHDFLAYLKSGPTDPAQTSTNSTGFFAAVNALPIRGMAGALVLNQSSAVSLHARPVRVYQEKASLVIFDKPKKPAD